jgi:putative ABC transport system substrate-binding protein
MLRFVFGEPMKRREFITLIGGAAVTWPLAAHAQKTRPVIGILQPGSPKAYTHLMHAFHQGLAETGYVEGKNVVIEFRWGGTDYVGLKELAADLVQRQVTVITVPFSLPASLAAKATTSSVPIVFGTGADAVQAGLVASLNRPGGNITGVSLMAAELGAKRLDLLQELRPAATRFAMLINPRDQLLIEPFVKSAQQAASTSGWHLTIVNASTHDEIEAVFARLAQGQVDALLVAPSGFFTNSVAQLAALATRYSLPASYYLAEFARAGGLMSYGPRVADLFRLVGVYTGRVLNGERPGELPVQLPTKYELIINLNAAKAIGITIPPTLLARADEVIESAD